MYALPDKVDFFAEKRIKLFVMLKDFKSAGVVLN
jgi:hypothetical protein